MIRPNTRRSRLPGLSAAAGILMALSGGCSDPTPEAGFTEVRSTDATPRRVDPSLTTGQRLGQERVQPARKAQSAPLLDYTLPVGWSDLGPSGQRIVDLRPAGEPEAECYLSFLQGDGGGLAANVARWYSQMGQPAPTPEDLDGLERRDFFAGQAYVVDVEGAFTAMGAPEPRPGYRMLGLIVPGARYTLFAKFTGPAEVVELERNRFFEWADSILPRPPEEPVHDEVHYPGDGHDHSPEDFDSPEDSDSAGITGTTEGSGGGYSWSAPASWSVQGPRPMRVVSFMAGPSTECYITVLGGDGGGLVSNLDRWNRQLGGPGIDGNAVALLPTTEVLGSSVPVLEVSGTYTGMDGQSRPDHTLLGVAQIGSTESLFVKMIGPRDEVEAARSGFFSFCESLEATP